MNDSSNSTDRRWLSMLLNALVCIGVLGASAAAVVFINRTEPTAQQINAKRKSAALVETERVSRGTYAPTISVLGTVRPAQEVSLSPRVRGQVTELSPKFVPGGMVREGDLLLQIDPADFENALLIRQSELQQREAALEIEEGRQGLAKKELELLGESIDETNRALVLREPQYASIQSQVAAARAAVQRAELDLQRTRILAPFDAQILERSVNIGSQVGTGDPLGRLVGIDEYWIIAAVPVRSLRWIQFPDDTHDGSTAMLRNPDSWGSSAERVAQVQRMIGSLDEQSRLARVLITVGDPLSRQSNAPPLILDTLIDVHIQGRPIPDVVRLRREYVHEKDTVWVMQQGQLEIRETKILFRDAEFAYIEEGLESGEEIVTTTLATVADGVGLRKISDPENADVSVEPTGGPSS